MATRDSKFSYVQEHPKKSFKIPFIPILTILTTLLLLSAIVISHATGTMTPWQQIGLSDKNVVSIAVSPSFANDATIFAATKKGLYKSTDSGQTWIKKVSGLKKKNIKSVVVSPSFATDRTLFLATKEHGIYKSTNAADSWNKLSCDHTIRGAEILVVSPGYQTDNTIFAAASGRRGGVYRSTDSGATWAKILSNPCRPIKAMAVAPDYQTNKTIFVALKKKLLRSTDAGSTWTNITPSHARKINSVAVSPAYPTDNTIFVGTNSYIHKTTNDGQTWTKLDSGLSKKINIVVLSPAFESDRTVFAASKGKKDPKGIFLSTDAGASFTTHNDGLTNTKILSLAISPTFATNGYTFAGTKDGIFKTEKLNIDNQAPQSTILEPTGEDTVTATSLLIKGTATDNIAVEKVNISIKREIDNYYFSPQESTWTPSPTAIETMVTTTEDSQTVDWQYIWDVPLCDAKRIIISSQAIDVSGNLQSSNSTVDIIVDNADLEGSFLIEDGRAYTTDTTVTTTNSVIQANLMRYSTDDTETFSDWEPYLTTKEISLPLGDGTKVIYAEFKRSSDNQVFSAQDDIILDTQAPIAGIISPANYNQIEGTTTISAIADDAVSGTAYVEFYANNQKIGEVSEAPYQIDWDTTQEINGPASIYIIAIDNAGNMMASNSVTVDIENPIPYVAAERIKDFLLIGPYKNTDSQTRLSADYFALDGDPSENNIHPMLFDDSIQVLDSPTDAIDINAYIPDSTECATYANVYVESPVSHTAMLSLGSTGGIKAWVNGELAIKNETESVFALDEDTATVSLNAGWNQLLIKTTNGASAEYKFSAKISDFDGGEIPELSYQLDNPFEPVLFEDNFNQAMPFLSGFWESTMTAIEFGEIRCEGSFNTRTDVDNSYSEIFGYRQADYCYSADVMFLPEMDSTITCYFILRAIDINNGYELGITENGKIAFYKKVNGIRTQIGPFVNKPIEPGQYYQVDIRAVSNKLTATIDNQTILQVTDPDDTFAQPGKIGAESTHAVYFNDIVVTPIDMEPWVVNGQVSDNQSNPANDIEITASTVLSDNGGELQQYSGLVASNGSYTIEVAADTPVELSVFTDSQEYSAKTISNINMSKDNPEEIIDVVLSATAAITGLVVDETGTPIKDAEVIPMSLDFASYGESTTTDENGMFTLSNLDAPGRYHLLVDAIDFTSELAETTITVSPGDTMQSQSITLTQAGKISGSVFDSYGNPIYGAMIIARMSDYDENERVADTLEDGSYVIEGLDAPADYNLQILADGYEVSREETISVLSGQTTTGVDFILGLEQAYGTRVRFETDDWTGLYNKEPLFEAVWVPNRENIEENKKKLDTHQWLVMQAASIMANDSVCSNAYKNLLSKLSGKSQAYWIQRGVRRADFDYYSVKYIDRDGPVREHTHHYRTHRGSYAGTYKWRRTTTWTSCADYAQERFQDACRLWKEGDKAKALYNFGLSLHHVQDLGVPGHNSKSWKKHRDLEEFYLDQLKDLKTLEPLWKAKDSNWQWLPAITDSDFVRDGIHMDPKNAYGWVDRLAHESKEYYREQVHNKKDNKGFLATKPLFKKAQQYTAGYIKYFYDNANKEMKSRSIDVRVNWYESDADGNMGDRIDINGNVVMHGPNPSQYRDYLTNTYIDSNYIWPGGRRDPQAKKDAVWLASPFDKGSYNIYIDNMTYPGRRYIKGVAEIRIGGEEYCVIESPAIDFYLPMDIYGWDICEIKEPSGVVKLINKILYIPLLT